MTGYESEIKGLLYRLGANTKYYGFAHTVHCVEEMLYNKEARECIKIAYISAQKRFNTDNYNIERDIRTMVRAIWESGNRDLLHEIAGQHLETRPKAKEFLNILTEYVLKEYVGSDLAVQEAAVTRQPEGRAIN